MQNQEVKKKKSTAKAPSKGILLIALGHPYYGRMAANLAVSLKNSSPDIQIALVCEGDSLSHLLPSFPKEKFFDHIIEAPRESYISAGDYDYIKAKTWMYDLSPFDKTIFLDVDMIWLAHRPVESLFAELADCTLTFQNRDCMDLSKAEENEGYSLWCNISHIKHGYGIAKGKYYSLHSEFVYFTKCAENRKFFNTVKKVFEKPKIKVTPWGTSIPDEFAFAMACILEDKYPHKDSFLPIFWQVANKDYKLAHELKEYYGYSAGGNNLSAHLKATYDNLAAWHYQTAGLQYPFKLQAKSSFLNERIKF